MKQRMYLAEYGKEYRVDTKCDCGYTHTVTTSCLIPIGVTSGEWVESRVKCPECSLVLVDVNGSVVIEE